MLIYDIREYNKLKKNLRKKFFSELCQKINDISPRDSLNFWKEIDQCKQKINPEDVSKSLGISDFVRHYKNLLNKEDNSYNQYYEEVENLFADTTEPMDFAFTCKEIKESISLLKCKKSACPDLIFNERINAGSSILITTIVKLFNKVLSEGKMPENWNLSSISSLYKAGDPCNRGLAVKTYRIKMSIHLRICV